MPKKYLDSDVYTETAKRIKICFEKFEKIYLSFSGGKDSSVMMHIVMDEAKRRNRKVGILFVDLEAQYKETINHVEEMIDKYASLIELYWISLPISLRNAVSMHQPKWCCWEPGIEWVRQPHKLSITDHKYFPFYKFGMEFEEFVPMFGEWYSEGKLTCCMVGIRADESLNRFRTIVRQNKKRYEHYGWTTQIMHDKINNLYNAYPIYDWKTQDIWAYNGKNMCIYNKLYDYMHKAGVSIHDQRICQPYGDDQRKGLWLFHLIEPETWGKVVSRVMGANYGSLYSKDAGAILGNIKQEKPDNITWKQYANILLESMPNASKVQFAQKIMVFINWYKTRGYSEGIPDEADKKLEAAKKVPSWRRICKTLLKNDFWCKSLSFAQTKSGNTYRVRESKGW